VKRQKTIQIQNPKARGNERIIQTKPEKGVGIGKQKVEIVPFDDVTRELVSQGEYPQTHPYPKNRPKVETVKIIGFQEQIRRAEFDHHGLRRHQRPKHPKDQQHFMKTQLTNGQLKRKAVVEAGKKANEAQFTYFSPPQNS
jgi:hypothetical protein